jgi:hypothetical protein
VPKAFVECTEIAGKTVKSAKIYENTVDGCETVIEFTDGTSFSGCVSSRQAIKATLLRGGVGTPQTLQDYEL